MLENGATDEALKFLQVGSTNSDLRTGFFSIAVLTSALHKHGLTLLSSEHEAVVEAMSEPAQEQGFIACKSCEHGHGAIDCS